MAIVENEKFTKIAPAYDESRVVPREVFDRLRGGLEARGIVSSDTNLADVGCGTGQYLAVFADSCASVTGIDVSARMLAVAREKIAGHPNVTLIRCDATAIDLDADQFDVTISSKLFLHIADWQKAIDEAIRVTRPGGYFVYVNELGYFTNDLRQRFRELCRDQHLPSGFAGEYDLDQISVAFQARGCRHESLSSDDLYWDRAITYRQAYRELERRSFAEFNAIGDDTYDRVLALVAEWAQAQPGGWEHVQQMRPHLRVDIYSVGG
jgi:ubiquinone/menaquinone biosynthesis C-methylase UbiE